MMQVVKDIWAAIKYVISKPQVDSKRYAQEPPKNWHGAPPQGVPNETEWYVGGERKRWGWAGEFLYDDGDTVAEQRGEKQREPAGITSAEYGEMLAHAPKLTNVVLAGQIKPLWVEGKKYKDIALLVGRSEQYVKYFCSCFERARRNSSKPNANEVPFTDF